MNRPAVYLIFLLSGVAGLGYELLWTRWLAVGLGHEYPATLAVIAAFFGGLALGAAAFDRAIARSARPVWWYAGSELVIAGWAGALVVLAPLAAVAFARLVGPAPSAAWQWFVCFGGSFLLLLPATGAMGATLPAVDRWLSQRLGTARRVGGLYAVNTLGAVGGILLTTNLLLPWLGIRASVVGMAGLNLLCAAGALVVDRLARGRSTSNGNELRRAHGADSRHASRERTRDEAAGRSRGRLLRTLFLTGALGVGYEVLAIRVLGQVLEDTVFTFAAALSVYLLGTAMGAALYQTAIAENARAARSGRASRSSERSSSGRSALHTATWLLYMQALAIVLTLPLLSRVGVMYDQARLRLGGSVGAAIAAEAIVAAVALWVPTLLMGATFSVLAQAARSSTGGLGRALAANTLGGALAPAVFGVGLLPAVGSKAALLVVAGAYALAAPKPRWLVLAAVLASGWLIWIIPFDLQLVMPRPGQELVAVREGVQSTASVLAGENERVLKVNRSFCMGGTGRGAFAQLRMGHLPLLRHPSPRRALFLGLGTGITFAAAGAHPKLEVDGVELAPEVVALLPLFAAENAALQQNPKLHVYTADARRFVRSCEQQYDVIVADLFHPARDGAALLYTREHFEAIAGRLTPGGVFCQWLPLYQLDPEALRLVVRTFASVFEQGEAVLAYYNTDTPVLGLMGVREDADAGARGRSTERGSTGHAATQASETIDLTGVSAGIRSADDVLSAALDRVGLEHMVERRGATLTTLGVLRDWAGAGPLNTDDHPRLAFEALRRAYLNSNPGWENLKTLLALQRPTAEALWPGLPGEERSAAERYVVARDAYLRGLHAWLSGDLDAARMELEASEAASDDFAAARAALDMMTRGRRPGPGTD